MVSTRLVIVPRGNSRHARLTGMAPSCFGHGPSSTGSDLRCDWASTGPSRDIPRSPIREAVDVGAIFDFVDPMESNWSSTYRPYRHNSSSTTVLTVRG